MPITAHPPSVGTRRHPPAARAPAPHRPNQRPHPGTGRGERSGARPEAGARDGGHTPAPAPSRSRAGSPQSADAGPANSPTRQQPPLAFDPTALSGLLWPAAATDGLGLEALVETRTNSAAEDPLTAGTASGPFDPYGAGYSRQENGVGMADAVSPAVTGDGAAPQIGALGTEAAGLAGLSITTSQEDGMGGVLPAVRESGTASQGLQAAAGRGKAEAGTGRDQQVETRAQQPHDDASPATPPPSVGQRRETRGPGAPPAAETVRRAYLSASVRPSAGAAGERDPRLPEAVGRLAEDPAQSLETLLDAMRGRPTASTADPLSPSGPLQGAKPSIQTVLAAPGSTEGPPPPVIGLGGLDDPSGSHASGRTEPTAEGTAERQGRQAPGAGDGAMGARMDRGMLAWVQGPGGITALGERAGSAASASGRAPAVAVPLPSLPARLAHLAAGLPEHGTVAVRLRLDPPSLGEIRVHIESSERGIEVRIVTQSHGACELLNGGQAHLQQELWRHGLSLQSFSASVGQEAGREPAFGQQHDPRPPGSRSQPPLVGVRPLSAVEPTSLSAALGAGGVLDRRA